MHLTNAKIRDLLHAHNQLDGYNKITTDKNGNESVVLTPYDFPSKTRWNITKNINVLRSHVEEVNKARDAALKRISEGTNEIDSEREPIKARQFAKEMGETEEIEVEVNGLLELKMVDLLNDDFEEAKKDKKKAVNPIGGTVLASLAPVLDLFKEDKVT